MSLILQLSIAAVCGYAIGIFPSAYVAGHLLAGRDIRDLGDGNPGAENVYFQLGPRAGLVVGALDILKGAASVLIFRLAGFEATAVLLSGFASVCGHNWPVLLQFRGGRGAASTFGVLAVVLFPVSLVGLLGAPVLLARKGTTATCAVIFTAMPLALWLLGYPMYLVLYAVGLPLMVGLVHFLRVVLPNYYQAGRSSIP